jgi:DnaJ-class molecular chaperone
MPAQDLYAVLECERGASVSELKRAYYAQSKIWHPDKAKTEDQKDEFTKKFQEISHAYEILSDDGKRAFYDQTGRVPGAAEEDGVSGAAGGGGGGGPFGFGGMPFPFDIGSMFGMFGPGGGGGGGRGRGSHNRKPGKAPPRKTQIPLSLKDFYFGRTLQINLDRHRFCSDCKGEGAVNAKECSDCRGAGIKQQLIQMGPGMMMQSTGPCSTCRGSGKSVGDKCGGCDGKKFVKQGANLELKIPAGMRYGGQVVFAGESSNVEDWEEAGDVVVEVIAADEDHDWERNGDNLKMRIVLTLGEALCGTTVKLMGHPAHEKGLFIEIPAGVQNRQEIVVEGCGMPRNGETGKFGDVVLALSVTPSASEKKLVEDMETRSKLRELFHVGVGAAATTEGDEKPSIFLAKPLSY